MVNSCRLAHMIIIPIQEISDMEATLKCAYVGRRWPSLKMATMLWYC